MIELDNNINKKFDLIVKKQREFSKTNYENPIEREKYSEGEIYKKFLNDYKKLYFNSENFNVYRIDKIIELFRKYLYKDDELYIGEMSMYDYVRISILFFDFLMDNYYYGFYRMNMSKISKIEFDEKIENLDNFLKKDYYEFPYSEYSDLKESMISFWNPFDEKLVKDLIKLYYVINYNTHICNDAKIYKRNIEEFITFKCMEYNVKDEAFEFLIHSPNSLNIWFIDNIYDYKSAKLVYDLLQEKSSKINFYDVKISNYFNDIINILKGTNDKYLEKVYNKLNIIDIAKLNIEDKIKVMQDIEETIFKKLKICGTYGDYDLYNEIFFDYRVQPKIFYEQYADSNNINLKDKKRDILMERGIESLINRVELSVESLQNFAKKFNNEDELSNFFIHQLEKKHININEITKDDLFKFLINYDYNLNNNNEIYKYIMNDHFTENKLRLLYQEMKGFFEDINYEIENFKYMKKKFVSLDNISRYIKESEEKCCMFELFELSKFYKKILIKEEYDQNVAYDYLLNDFNKINNLNSEDIVNKVLCYTKVKKVLFSASYLWNLFEKTDNINIDKDGKDYTPIVANYFKSVELLLYYKIKEKCKKMMETGIELLPIYNTKGLKINILNDDELTLGEMYRYIKREKRLVKDFLDNTILADKIKYWSDNIRNSHFHKDLILSKSLAYKLKYETLLLINEIIFYFD